MFDPLSIFLVEDDPDLCEIVSGCVRDLPAEIVGHCTQGSAAVEMIARLKPGYTILDIDMPDVNAAEVIRRMREVHPAIRIIVVSASRDKPMIRQLFHRGASGYVMKASLPDELADAIKAVKAQSLYVSPGLRDE